MPDEPRPVRSEGRFVDTLKAVGWAFFGVRKGRAHEHDMSRLNPVHVIIAGICAAIVFVAILVLVARTAAG